MASAKLAARRRSEEFAIPLSRLSDIETKNIVPSIYRMYSLAIIYRRDMRELLSWYGVDLNDAAGDLSVVEPPKSHLLEALTPATAAKVPVRIDPGFDARKTTNLGRMVQQWGVLPMCFLAEFAESSYTYAYLGTEDLTMYPIMLPGTFLQIDDRKNTVVNGVWRSEYERPIYFVETRQGYTCSWCTLKNGQLILQSHPLSPVPVRILAYPKDAEIVGQVVGMAMKLGDWIPCQPAPDSRELAEPN
ncbi:MAG: hypothetical protein ACE14L_06275 [Terriglobales bacterium]